MNRSISNRSFVARIIGVVFAVGGCLHLGIAQAYDEGSVYVGVDIGKPKLIYSVGSTGGGQNGFASGNPQRDEQSVTVAQVRVGYQIFESLGLEAWLGQGTGEAEFRDTSFSDGAGGTIDDPNVDVDRYYGVFIRPGQQVASWLGLHANLGYTAAELTARDSATGGNVRKQKINGFSWGFGFDVPIGKLVLITANYTMYVDESIGEDEDVRLAGMTLGARFNFGTGDDD